MHIVMYPWFAFGHLSSFMHISNKLAHMGHQISFLVPTKSQGLLQPLNMYPDMISFFHVTVPHLPGLPVGAETTSDVPFHLQPLLMSAMDLTHESVDSILVRLRPHLVVFDFAHWLPILARSLSIKSLHYCTISAATIGFLLSPSRPPPEFASQLMAPPPGFPASSAVKLAAHEARGLFSIHGGAAVGGAPVSFQERQMAALSNCDAIAFRTCREVEGPYCDYLERQFNKPVLLAGPVLPEPPTAAALDERWRNWLDRFAPTSVIYCAFGSECVLAKSQFQQLVLGLELTGKPFLAVLKPPFGTETVEESLPEGFEARVESRGAVYGGWVQQQLILSHPSVGCFVTHCGSGSLSEAMVTKCQLVLVPDKGDQIINARMMAGDLKVGVEVEKGDEDGEFSKEGVCKAIRSVMDDDSDVGKEVRANHDKNRELLLKPGFEASYFHTFVEKLQKLVNSEAK